MLAVQIFYGGIWQHAETADDELTARRLVKAYREEHGAPTRVAPKGEDYETTWRPSGRDQRASVLRDASCTQGRSDDLDRPVRLCSRMRVAEG